MTVGRICRRQLDLAETGETVRTAAQRMGARGVGTLVVVDEDRKPVGILTDRDVAVRVAGAGLDAGSTRVSEVMTHGPRAVSEDTSIEEALGEMRDAGIRRILILGEDEDLIGIVSLDDILRHLAEELGAVEGLLEESSPDSLASV